MGLEVERRPAAGTVGAEISKVPRDVGRFRRPVLLFPKARSAFRALLEALRIDRGESILLPAYIGRSNGEGGGLFDPVAELGLEFQHYAVDSRLHVDLDDLRAKLRDGRVRALLLVHYFGYVDPRVADTAALGREYGAWVIEDAAHALYTDFVGGRAGRYGDACLHSLHKMLPVKSGGMLVLNAGAAELESRLHGIAPEASWPWQYDLAEISVRRRANAALLTRLLAPLADRVRPLWGDPPEGVVPQTYPVLVPRGARDRLHAMLNAAGFGVVSLWYRLVETIRREEYPASHELAETVLNLPVHQEIHPGMLEALVKMLGTSLDLLQGAKP